MHKIVISNTSPIFYLNKIGHLELLKRLYGEIVIFLKTKKEGLIKEIKPIMNRLKDLGFFLKDKLIADIIKLADEG